MPLASLLLPFLVGFLAAWKVLPSGPGRVGLILALGAPLGLGLGSLGFFLEAALRDTTQPGSPLCQVLPLALLCLVLALAPSPASTPCPDPVPVPAHLRTMYVVVCACALATVLVLLAREPHGGIDAWAIWTQRARFLYRGGDDWKAAFTPLIGWAHTDYPLLVPGAIARGWTLLGGESTLVPRLIALAYGAAAAGLLHAGLTRLAGRRPALLATMVLLGAPPFLEHVTRLYADVPLACYFLATLVLLEVYEQDPARRPWLPVLAGLTAGMAAWTKNEGLLFLVVLIVAWLTLPGGVGPRARLLPLLPLVAGGLLPLLALGYFKAALAPANDLVAGQGVQATLTRLLTPWRYLTLLGYLLATLATWGWGVLWLLVLHRRRTPLGIPSGSGRLTARVLILMSAGYALVYLTSPHDLSFHVPTSLDRLLLQLWPMFLLAYFLRLPVPPARATPSPGGECREKM